jgi:putative protease
MNKRPELLAPAGDLEKLETAFQYGADACYMGVPIMSMRARENKTASTDIEKALKISKKLGKKLYLTINIHMHENMLGFLKKELDFLKSLHKKKLDPDGILISDAGVFFAVKQACPWVNLHISTQANTLNSEAIEFWAAQGATRVVLGREVSLRELKEIRRNLKKRKINIEIEGFVHGSMCMAYSGRCLLSSFLAGRDANQGICAHCCRWKYKVYLEEEQRPGVYIPLEEDNSGAYLMSSKDMCMVEHLSDLMSAGLDSFKIEGRNKTTYYLALVTRAYRMALDLAQKGKPVTPSILDLVESINNRGYFTGFWYGKPGHEGQIYKDRPISNAKYCFAGLIKSFDGKKAVMEVRNRLDKGDRLEIICPDKNIAFVLDKFNDAKTKESLSLASAGQDLSIEFKISGEIKSGFVVRKKF